MNFVILPIAHGVELKQIGKDYASPLIDKVNALLDAGERRCALWLPYNYTVSTNPRQLAMFEATDKGLGNETLRLLKHTVGSDVTWSFIVSKDGKECFYADFVKDLAAMIEEKRDGMENRKVLCIGHSQGTQLFYSFFFDYGKTVDGFISMGSPISMNSGAYVGGGKLAKNLRSWDNVYHWMDFISSRMQGCPEPFSQEIAGFVKDHEVKAAWWKLLYKLPKGFCKFMLAAGLKSHVSYWEEDFVAELIAAKIKELIYEGDRK